jgi:uncharacterized membrane protein YfcA
MSVFMLIVASMLALLVGVSLGVMGGGGSILTVPILRYVLRYEAHRAIAVSMLVVGATSLAALVPHALRRHVRWKVGGTFGAAGMVGAFLAGRLAHFIPSVVLLAAFALMMWVTAFAMLHERAVAQRAPAAPNSLRRTIAHGFGVGVITGLLGAGGGFVVVPALIFLANLPMEQAVGTSLVVVAMNAAAGFLGLAGGVVAIDMRVAITMVTAAVVGSVAGGLATHSISPGSLRKSFGWFVVAMGLFVLTQELPSVWHD